MFSCFDKTFTLNISLKLLNLTKVFTTTIFTYYNKLTHKMSKWSAHIKCQNDLHISYKKMIGTQKLLNVCELIDELQKNE